MEEMLTVVDEPMDDTYLALLGFAARLRSQFSLVWREQTKFGESALEIARLLKADLIAEARTDEWPGTRLIGHMATVRRYELSENARGVLERARGLYDWQEPVASGSDRSRMSEMPSFTHRPSMFGNLPLRSEG